MYGKTTGKLMVHFTENGGAKYLLFYKEGNQGTGWKKFSKSINTALQYRVCSAPSFIWSGVSAIRTPKTGKFCSLNPEVLACRTTNSESHLDLDAWNPESTFHWQRLKNLVLGFQNQRCVSKIKDCIGIPCMGRNWNHGVKRLRRLPVNKPLCLIAINS